MGVQHPVLTKYGKNLEQKVRERAVGSKKSDVLWNVDDSEVPKSFPEVIQIFSEKKVACVDLNALVADSVHVVWLNLNAKQERCLIDDGQTLLGFLQVGSGEMELE